MSDLSLRDQIALAVLPAMFNDDLGTVEEAAKEIGIPVADYNYRLHWPTLAARKAYKYADAMLAERDRPSLATQPEHVALYKKAAISLHDALLELDQTT